MGTIHYVLGTPICAAHAALRRGKRNVRFPTRSLAALRRDGVIVTKRTIDPSTLCGLCQLEQRQAKLDADTQRRKELRAQRK